MARESPRLPSATAQRAHDLSAQRNHPAVHAHSVRSWLFAEALAGAHGLDVDLDLLATAAMLHDIGLTPPLVAAEEAFEVVGGSVAAAFAIGAGWGAGRAQRVAEVVERHMWRSVDPALDPEAHLLELATSLDVGGAGLDAWDPELLREIAARLPRGDFADVFAALIAEQAERGPATPAARLHGSGRIDAGERAWAALLASR